MKRRISTYLFSKPSILTEQLKKELPTKIKKYSEFIQNTNITETKLEDYNKEYIKFLQNKTKPSNEVLFMYSTHLLRPINFNRFMTKHKLKYPNSWYKIQEGKIKKGSSKKEITDLITLDLLEEASK